MGIIKPIASGIVIVWTVCLVVTLIGIIAGLDPIFAAIIGSGIFSITSVILIVLAIFAPKKRDLLSH